MSDKIIVALDKMEEAAALDLARKLKGKVWGFKVNDLLIKAGVRIVTELKAYGNVFADPKLYDIPNTVSNAVSVLSAAGADFITVHASGGREMLEAAVEKSGPAKILAVTILTSMELATVERSYRRPTEDAVKNFAALARESGVPGIVCSPQDLILFSGDALSDPPLRPLLKVTPGVRPSWYGAQDDQVRVLTPKEAVSLGASHIVIGRPITSAADPLQAVQKIIAELA